MNIGSIPSHWDVIEGIGAQVLLDRNRCRLRGTIHPDTGAVALLTRFAPQPAIHPNGGQAIVVYDRSTMQKVFCSASFRNHVPFDWKLAGDEVLAWLGVNYPNWRDPIAYWDDEVQTNE